MRFWWEQKSSYMSPQGLFSAPSGLMTQFIKTKISQWNILREARLQMRNEELCGDDDVVEDDEVSAEAVAGAELCQH